MGNTFELVVDDELRYKLDKAKHVDCLSKSSDDEGIPTTMRPTGCELRIKWALTRELAHS